jgi:transcriptional regulator with XRE-family HTH domain
VTDLSAAIADCVRGERSARHWTQAYLGKLVGISGTTVSDIENHRRLIAVDELPKLCEALDLSLVELVRRADDADLQRMKIPQ